MTLGNIVCPILHINGKKTVFYNSVRESVPPNVTTAKCGVSQNKVMGEIVPSRSFTVSEIKRGFTEMGMNHWFGGSARFV